MSVTRHIGAESAKAYHNREHMMNDSISGFSILIIKKPLCAVFLFSCLCSRSYYTDIPPAEGCGASARLFHIQYIVRQYRQRRRDVFVVPGAIDDASFEGSNDLLKNGAEKAMEIKKHFKK